MELLVFFNDTATTEIYTLSLHDALPICKPVEFSVVARGAPGYEEFGGAQPWEQGAKQVVKTDTNGVRSEEHTSELQSRQYLVCRLLPEKNRKIATRPWSPLPTTPCRPQN